MPVINKVTKTGLLNQWDIVKFQFVLYAHFNDISLSKADIDILCIVALNKEASLIDICNACCYEDERDKDLNLKHFKEILKTPQSVRNSITKLERIKLIQKISKNKKNIKINSKLDIQTEYNILIELKLLRKYEA